MTLDPKADPEFSLDQLIDEAWQALLDMDDRTSPEEYPDMALIKPDEFRGVITSFVNDALASASAGEVVVKALEWTEQAIPPTGECLAYSPVGLYCIPLGRAKFTVRFRDRDEDGPYETLADAKAAAQADYERRIRSALTAPPATPAVEITEDMVERACRAHREYWLNLRNKPDEKAAMRPTLAAALAGKG